MLVEDWMQIIKRKLLSTVVHVGKWKVVLTGLTAGQTLSPGDRRDNAMGGVHGVIRHCIEASESQHADTVKPWT